MTNRIATYTGYANLSRDTQRLQVGYANYTTQTSSGLKSETFSGIADKSQLLLALQNDVARKKSYADTLTTVSTRVETAYDAVNNITDTISSALTTVSAAISGSLLSAAEVQQSAQNAYDAIIASLNSQVGGRYLFGGSNISSPPVDVADPAYPAFTSPTTANTSYYQGDNVVQGVRADQGLTINYGVTADAAGFEKALRALNLIINNPSNSTALTEASGLLQTANDEIGTIAQQVSLNANAIEDKISAHKAAQTYLENTIADINEVDVAEATVKAKQAETQLEATYSLTSTLLSLSILQYLR